MADVFGRQDSPFVGAFAADSSVVTVGTVKGARMLIQNIQVGYQQAVNQIFELGSNNRYYVVGRTNGNMSLARIVGPVKMNQDVLKMFGNVCEGNPSEKSLTFDLGTSSCNAVAFQENIVGHQDGNVKIRADGCVATGVTYAIQAQDMLINENVTLMFGQLSKI